MTPGIPGTGIGGLFYMLSAMALPLREGYRRLSRGVAGARWRVIALQQLLATGILGGVWTTGWLLGHLFHVARAPFLTAMAARDHNVWSTWTFALSLATLTFVIATVELMGLWYRRRHRFAQRVPQISAPPPTPVEPVPPGARIPGSRRVAVAGGGERRRWLFLLLVAELVAAANPSAAVPQARGAVAISVARAESTYATGDRAAAARAYAAVLAIDPENSRATYRLADLQRHDPARALPLFEKYVALEPTDVWGYLAVADMLSRLGRHNEAVRWSDEALRRAPEERDARLGRARVFARAHRTDAALVAYRAWLSDHPRDAEAWQELSRELVRAGRPGEAVNALDRAQAVAPDPKVAERRVLVGGMAAPAFTPLVSGSHDSDGNTIWRFGGALELGAMGPARVGIEGGRSQVGDGASDVALDALALRTTWQPSAALKIDASGGGTRIGAIAGSGAALVPTGRLHARWRAPAPRFDLDLRADHDVVDASPLLVANRVIRTQFSGLLSLPVAGPITVRGIGKAATLADSFETNHKTTLSGVMAIAVAPAGEVSAQFHQIHYDHPSVSGYFAPWQVQVAEVGTYVEIETARSVLVAVDGGAGMQRVAEQPNHFAAWKPAFRLYVMLDAPLAPGRDVRLELESEDSQVATTAATSGQWRYLSLLASLRWALP